MIHVPGVLSFLGADPALSDFADTSLGFEVTLAGMAAFVAGAVAASLPARTAPDTVARSPEPTFERVGWRALAIGAGSYLLLSFVFGRLASTTAIVSSLPNLVILGFWMLLYQTGSPADARRRLLALGLLPLLPLTSLVAGGFLAYGIHWVLVILAFCYVVARRRLWFYLASPLLVFLGLSLFVTYMGQREAIRDVVWYEQASVLDRIEQVSRIITDFQLLDLSSDAHLTALDDRLNQNELVGAAVAGHRAGFYDFAYGGTVPLWGFVPRALWPDKPAVGGGGSLVTEYTGIPFEEGTSVGAGQVLEFYVNFGIPGVLAGFAGLGFLLMRLDIGMMRAFVAGDLAGMLLRALPGLSLLQPGGNLLEILVAFVGATLCAAALLYSGVFGRAPPPRPTVCRTADHRTLSGCRNDAGPGASQPSARLARCMLSPGWTLRRADPPTVCRGSVKHSPRRESNPCCCRSSDRDPPCDTRRSGYRDRRFAQDLARVPGLRALRRSAAFSAALKEAVADADLVHDHGLWLSPNLQAGWAAAAAGKPFVVSPRGMLSPPALAFSQAKKRVFWTLLQGPVMRRAACIHATSDQEYAELRAFGLRQPICGHPERHRHTGAAPRRVRRLRARTDRAVVGPHAPEEGA